VAVAIGLPAARLQTARWRGAKRLARGETSGVGQESFSALEMCEEYLCAPSARWLRITRAPDVSRLATFVLPLPRQGHSEIHLQPFQGWNMFSLFPKVLPWAKVSNAFGVEKFGDFRFVCPQAASQETPTKNSGCKVESSRAPVRYLSSSSLQPETLGMAP
jgi:hypothetical protein